VTAQKILLNVSRKSLSKDISVRYRAKINREICLCGILGGGVMNQKQVFPNIFKYLQEQLNGYISLPELSEYIASPGSGDHAGITGSLLLAHQAFQKYE
jgi:hypothetical protein